MAIQGFRHTANFAVDERPKSWREGILLRYPNGNTPLFALTNLMKSEKVDDPEFNWWDKPVQDRRVRLAAAINGTDTSTAMNVHAETNALLFKPGDLFYSPQTGERFLVTAVASASGPGAITMQRGFGGTTVTALNPTAAGSHPYLLNIGSVYEEGSDRPAPIGNDPQKHYNYTQIFRDTIAMTRTASKTKLRTKDQVKEARRECLEIHAMGIERALLFGVRWEGTINGKPARTTRGITGWLPADRVVDAGATTNMDQLESYLELMFRFGSSEKLGFCGSTALLIIQKIVRKNTNYQIFANEKEYGMKVLRLVTPFGELVLKNHPMFNLDRQTSALAYQWSMASSIVVVDGNNLVYRYVDDTTYQPKLQDNGIDGMESGFLTECGLELHHPESFMWLRNLQAAAIDT